MLSRGEPSGPRRRRLLAGLSISETVSWGVLYYAFAVFVGPMEAETGWSRTETSLAFSLGLLVSAAAAPAAGWIVDRGGARILMTSGSCLGALLLLAWSGVETLAGLYAVWLGIGLAMAATLYEPAFAILAKGFRRDRPRALTTLTLVAGLASAIFLPLAAHLVERQGWRSALVSLALVLAALAAPIHALVLRRLPGGRPSIARDGVRPRVALRSPAFGRLAAAFVLGGFATAALGVHLVSYFTLRGESPSTSALLVGAIGAMQLPGRLLFAPLAARLPARAMTAPIFLLQGSALLVLLLAPGRPGAVAFVVCFGMANGLMTLARAMIVAEVFGTTHYGSIAGTLAAFTTGARGLGPLAAGWIYDSAGGYEPLLWLLAGALGLAGAAGHGGRPPRARIARGLSSIGRPARGNMRRAGTPTREASMDRVIFACRHNAGRSQMAAAFFDRLADPARVKAISAGTTPVPRVHPEVAEVMRELGIDLTGARPRLLTPELAAGSRLLVTLGCGEECPHVPGVEVQDWPLDDPKGRPVEEVRRIREQIRQRVATLLQERGWGRPGGS